MQDNNIYVNTYFRVNSGYVWGEGHPEELNTAFRKEIEEIFSTLGFEITNPTQSYYCQTGTRENESLYFHPQALSGFIKQESIPLIEEALKSAKSFKHYHTDTYEKALNYTREEFRSKLEGCRQDIEMAILTAFQTKRKNLFKHENTINNISSGVKCLDDRIQNSERTFIAEVFEDLLQQGKLEKAQLYKGGTGYRSTVKPPKSTPETKEHSKPNSMTLF